MKADPNKRSLWLETIFEHTSVGILITDPTKEDNPILYSNPAFREISGYSHEEVVGKNCRFLQGKDTNAETVTEIRNAILSGKTFKGEILNYRKSGDPFWNELIVNPVYGQYGKLEYFVGIQNDITRRKTLEIEFQSDLQLARKIQELSLSTPILNEDIKISGMLLPSKQIGGDSYSWFELGPNEYGVLLLDVMGNGIPASLISMSIHSFLHYLLRTNLKEPKTVLEKINTHLFELFTTNNQVSFTTAIYLHLDLNQHTLTYANAGHVSGIKTTGKTSTKLHSLSLPLGLTSDYNCRQETLLLSGNERILLFSDGLVESADKNIKERIDRLQLLIQNNLSLSQEGIMKVMLRELVREKKNADDISMVVIDISLEKKRIKPS
ncbi:PAS domain-containing protein [Anaerobacillus alkaliphilus]|uniref:PAS domain-containing protein n=1 Tax=Anaerobacillus alkaliphilus TaxID=1548597 RepID=A0A4Q0VP55_9BACI|nr:PP2C family protein-serine/threonine phosphatase [Anaerobacillus alkaliphilus]RXI97821.1 PAS domain-containing protein [Anaerobacillus alkaliphilus]